MKRSANIDNMARFCVQQELYITTNSRTIQFNQNKNNSILKEECRLLFGTDYVDEATQNQDNPNDIKNKQSPRIINTNNIKVIPSSDISDVIIQNQLSSAYLQQINDLKEKISKDEEKRKIIDIHRRVENRIHYEEMENLRIISEKCMSDAQEYVNDINRLKARISKLKHEVRGVSDIQKQYLQKEKELTEK